MTTTRCIEAKGGLKVLHYDQGPGRTNAQLPRLVLMFAAFYFELINLAIITQVNNYLRSD